MRPESSHSTFPLTPIAVEKDADRIEVRMEDVENEGTQGQNNYLEGLRLRALTVAVGLSIFLVHFEISIVSTSLVSITDDLGGFGRSSWVITGYLLTYIGFMVIVSKLSDSIGRKRVLVSSLAIFTVFSGACGAAQTMNQLIVFRAFQGLGSAGIFTLGTIVLFEMVPKVKYAKYAAGIGALFGVSFVSGPLLGGIISEQTTWRWVFLLNVPAGIVAIGMLLLCLPNNFPHHGQPNQDCTSQAQKLDLVGASLMLAALILIITGFEEASNFSPWVSTKVLAPILISGPIFVVFLSYERWVTRRQDNGPEPVFPWRFFKSRAIMSVLLNSFLVGCVFITCVIQIPLRFQAVNNESPWRAGVRLVPFGMAVPLGGGIVSALCSKRRLPPVYVLLLASVLQIVGVYFMSRLTLDRIMWRGQYGLQVVAGLGCGFTVGLTTLTMPFVIDQRDLATSTSAVVQFRTLGGALALAIVTAIMNSNINGKLSSLLNTTELAQILRTSQAIHDLEEPVRTVVKHVFLTGYNLQFRILLGLAAAQIPATLLMWQREQIRIG